MDTNRHRFGEEIEQKDAEPSGAGWEMEYRSIGVLGTKGVDLCVTKFGLFREVPQKSTKVRTDQARKSSMLRIVTGETNFLTVTANDTQLREHFFPFQRVDGLFHLPKVSARSNQL